MSHNPIRPWRNIQRRPSRQIRVGKVLVGGDAPISVQTMTNTITSDVKATIEQVQRCAVAGADIVRISTPDEDATRALREIVAESPVPIVADIHFHYRRAIEAAKAGAACLRINPGNIGSADRVREVVKAAKDHGCSIRIGVNAGSLERHLLEKYGEPCPEAMVESGLDHIKLLQDNDFHEFKISVKGVRRLPCRCRLSAAGGCDRRAHPSGHHRSRGACLGHRQVGHRAWQPSVDGDRRHDPRIAFGRSGRRGEGRVRDPEIAGAAAPGGHDHLLPLLRAAGV